jgi:hypothetical protein
MNLNSHQSNRPANPPTRLRHCVTALSQKFCATPHKKHVCSVYGQRTVNALFISAHIHLFTVVSASHQHQHPRPGTSAQHSPSLPFPVIAVKDEGSTLHSPLKAHDRIPDDAPELIAGIHRRGRCHLFRRMDPFQKGHFEPLCPEIAERSQLEFIYTVSHFQ